MKLGLTLFGLGAAQWEAAYAPGHGGMVHLFEWSHAAIAEECEKMLGPKKWGAVQVSPPTENRLVGGQWWERYQPISYKLENRSGNHQEFADMVRRCNAVGVRTFVDVIPNHMCGGGGSGTGSGGTFFDAGSLDFPGVPYSRNDMNDNNCYTSSGNIENYGDANQVRNCRLVNLIDLNQGTEYVRGKLVDYLNQFIDLGAAGFRVDACKHMWPGDLEVIFGRLKNLNVRSGFKGTERPFIFQEVIDQGGEPITANEYTGFGRVTEFKYCMGVGSNTQSLKHLANIGPDWGYLSPMSSVVFVNNHDNQRGHGGGGHVVTFEESWALKTLTTFMMGHDYGEPRVMSSYYFSDPDEGPPGWQPNGFNGGFGCENGWVCEHRWRAIQNLGMFRGSVFGTGVTKWSEGWDNQIAFSRGNKGFMAINGGSSNWSGSIATSMPDGEYCDLGQGDPTDGGCTGPTIRVSGGQAQINVPTGDSPVSYISVSYTATGGGNNGGGDGGTGGSSCNVSDSGKRDCGYMGINSSQCQALGCCWSESQTGGVPWCFYPAF